MLQQEIVADDRCRKTAHARYDLKRAEHSHAEEDYKWASVQAYYSLFHAAKGLVLSKGYREKSHRCLIVALEELFVSTGIVPAELVSDLELCMEIRHDADYGLVYSGSRSKTVIETAKEWLDVAEGILENGQI